MNKCALKLKPNSLLNDSGFECLIAQKNRAFDMGILKPQWSVSPKIKKVQTENKSIEFANTASEPFGYLIKHQMVFEIAKHSKTV